MPSRNTGTRLRLFNKWRANAQANIRARGGRKFRAKGGISFSETKFSTAYNGYVVTPAAPAILLCNALSQGNTRQNRQGNKIRMQSLAFNLRASLTATIVAGGNLRMMIVQDKQPNLALLTAATVADLFLDPTNTNWYFAFKNPNTVPRRYQVLYDKAWKVEANMPTLVAAGATTTESSFQVVKKILKPLKQRVVQYNEANAGTIADIESPALYVILFSDVSMTVNSEVMFKYKDY